MRHRSDRLGVPIGRAITGLFLAPVLVAFQSTDAAAAMAYVYFDDYQNPASNVLLQNTTGARIEYRMPMNIVGHSGDNGGGYVAPRTGAMGGYAYAHIPNDPNGADAAYSVETAYSYKVKVQAQTAPGNSPSLSLGDPVWLRFSIRVDGTFRPLNSYPRGRDSSSIGMVDVSSGVRVTGCALPDPHCVSSGTEGPDTSQLVRFELDARSENWSQLVYSQTLEEGTWDHDYFDWSWALYTDGQFTPTDGNSVVKENNDSYCYGILSCGIKGSYGILHEHNVDTGLITYDFLVHVGEELEIGSTLNVFAQAYGDQDTPMISDFSNTSVAQVTALTPGVVLQSDITAVPVPPAVWLFGSGLLGVLLAGRRRA